MTQHTNRFSQQQAIPQAWTALHENSTAVQPARACREGGLGWRWRRAAWDTEFSPMGMSCQPCHEGKRHGPVCSADLCHKAQLYWLRGDVVS